MAGNERDEIATLVAAGTKTLFHAVVKLTPPARRRLLREGEGANVLLAAALHPSLLERAAEHSPLLPALLRGVKQRRDLLMAEGGTLSGEMLAKTLGITRQAVDKQRRRGQLLAIHEGATWRYPAWQIADGTPIAGLKPALAALRKHPAWTVVAFLLSRNTRLGARRPIDLMRRGEVEPVLRAAKAYGQHGAA
ncbi:MAG TPA: hypothetical protein VJT32_02235 [bacterium]|nr:hypothetical protein [bacterium]